MIGVPGFCAALLALQAAATPSRTPDQIAFSSDRTGKQYDIYVMNADGTGVTNLTNHAGNDMNPAWSRDGSKIAFQSNRDGNFEIYVMNADGSNQTRLTNNRANDVVPSWSPDGDRVAFLSFRDGTS